LRTACRQLQSWKAEWRDRIQQASDTQSSTRFTGEHLQKMRISVNISALQFGRTEFYSSVVRALAESGLDAASLELELTESVLMQNVEESARQMETLRSLGVRIAVDDFGTGYSSLAYLQRLPMDVLKIDRSFIHDIHHKDVSKSLVQAIVTLGHSLNLQVLAEGAEVPGEVEALRELKCDLVQGFVVTPPLAPDDVTTFLFSHDAGTNEAQSLIENFSAKSEI